VAALTWITSFRSGLILLAGATLLATALVLQLVLGETVALTLVVTAAGAGLAAAGAWALRAELGTLVRRRRGELALYTAGVIGVLIVGAWLSVRFPLRFDFTESGRYSLSEPTVTMLKKLERPVHIVFFNDPLMRETVELYELMARQTPKVTVAFFDPVLNPAQARMHGVQFAGTAVMESEGRKLQVSSGSETDIANGILRVSRSATQRVCFLDGHGEADPFSLESHDHLEGAPGHKHGLGVQYVLHERHGMAKARHALETLNYEVKKLTLVQGGDALRGCTVLVVAGPKTALLPVEVTAVRAYLAGGGNGFFLLDPFVATGLEAVIRDYGVVVDDDMVIDEASHFWADMSSPAVSDYNRHQVTRELPLTFFPGVRSLSPTKERVPDTGRAAARQLVEEELGQANRERIELTAARDQAGADDADGPRAAAGRGRRRGRRRARRSRIAVVGDSDFATNSFFHIMGNGTLFVNTVSYPRRAGELIGITPRTHDLPRVNLTNRQMKGTFRALRRPRPALLGVIGTAVWWKQR
jgi:hypothetical protein